jgi:hypothetical protein
LLTATNPITYITKTNNIAITSSSLLLCAADIQQGEVPPPARCIS